MFFTYKNQTYPNFIKEGFHSQYIIPIASKFCKGRGIDIGCANDYWAFPGAEKCDKNMKEPWNDALKIPVEDSYYDYVFSSHCLEHIEKYVDALIEWTRILKNDGILFLYLPSSIDCEYWRPFNDKRHIHNIHTEDIKYDLINLEYKNILISGVDLAYSYSICAQKK